MTYSIQQKVLFKHCDPARIVFYPRYFEIINDTVEFFFADVLDYPFEYLHETGGVPTVEINTRFLAPSRHGDMLSIDLMVTHVGSTSLGINITMSCEQQQRLTVSMVLVNIDLQGKPSLWPKSVKEKATKHLQTST